MAVGGVDDGRCIALSEASRQPGGYDVIWCRVWSRVTDAAVFCLPGRLVERLIGAAGNLSGHFYSPSQIVVIGLDPSQSRSGSKWRASPALSKATQMTAQALAVRQKSVIFMILFLL